MPQKTTLAQTAWADAQTLDRDQVRRVLGKLLFGLGFTREELDKMVGDRCEGGVQTGTREITGLGINDLKKPYNRAFVLAIAGILADGINAVVASYES